MPDVPPLPPSDFDAWPTSDNPTEEMSVALDIIASALIAIAYDLRQTRTMLEDLLGKGAKDAGKRPRRRTRQSKGSPPKGPQTE